jgi:hypothetical protein
VCINTNGKPGDFSQVSLGDITPISVNTFGHYFLTGQVAEVIIYAGSNGAIDLNPEGFLLSKYNL